MAKKVPRPTILQVRETRPFVDVWDTCSFSPHFTEEVAVQDSDEEYNYEEIPVEEFDDLSESDGEETLEKVVRSINEKAFFGGMIFIHFSGRYGTLIACSVPLESSLKPEEISAGVEKQPEVVDDFIRNFLSSKGLMKSLDAFQVAHLSHSMAFQHLIYKISRMNGTNSSRSNVSLSRTRS